MMLAVTLLILVEATPRSNTPADIAHTVCWFIDKLLFLLYCFIYILFYATFKYINGCSDKQS